MSENADMAAASSPKAEDQEDDLLLQRIVDTISPDSRVLTVELLITVILAIAGVLTAWSALQSAKWSGEQAIHFSEAGASRTESTRFDNRSTSIILLDTQTFLSWAEAIGAEAVAAEAAGEGSAIAAPQDGDPLTLSSYIFSQFRADFKPRVQAWLDGGGPNNPDGSSPFFPLEEYIAESIPSATEAESLRAQADESAALARQDNQNSDNYVVTVVLLASVLFFAGVSSKMRSPRNQNLMFLLSVSMLLWACLRLLTLPIHAVP